MGKQDGSARRVTIGPVDDSATRFLHVDIDAFFASVEILKDPSLRGKPVVVGGKGPRSVVAAASYEARRFGVNSAMPMTVALRRCPHAVVVPVDGAAYASYSARVMAILESFTPLVQPLSVDEAFLDVSGVRRLWGSPGEIAARIRARVAYETGLTCSVGVAATMFMAKLASGKAKPDGLLVVPPDQVEAFLAPLPVIELWGVGPALAERLRKIGVETAGELAETPESLLRRAVGAAASGRLRDLARGIDSRQVTPQRQEKSIGHENTFGVDVLRRDELAGVLLSQSEDVARRLRAAGVAARTLTLKLRYADFRTVTRSRTLAEPSNVAQRIYREVDELLRELWIEPEPIRLIGVRAERLTRESDSPALVDPDEEWRGAERAIDALTQRFGAGTIAPAKLLRVRRRYASGLDLSTGRGLASYNGQLETSRDELSGHADSASRS